MSVGINRCAVLGSPIEHSLSPVLHRAGYAALGLVGWDYGRYEVRESELADFVARCDPTWRGLSLTMPLKLVALDVGRPDELARLVGAANTLIFDHTSGRHLVTNTDVGGMVNAVRGVGLSEVVCGHGARRGWHGAGRADLARAARGPAGDARAAYARARRAAETARRRPGPGPGRPALVGAAARPPICLSRLPSRERPTVWPRRPWPPLRSSSTSSTTRGRRALAVAAEARGRVVLSGLDLLVHQAVLQFELMTGHLLDPRSCWPPVARRSARTGA